MNQTDWSQFTPIKTQPNNINWDDFTPAKQGLSNNGEDTTFDKFSRGYQSAALRVPEFASGIDNILGTSFVPNENKQKINMTRESLDKQKEETSQLSITPERKIEIDDLKKETQNVTGTWGNVKAGAKQLYDVATHPSEWTTQGITEGLLAPENIASFGVGSIATKGLPLLARAVKGGVAGGAQNVATSTPVDYVVARGQNKSDEEAKNIAIQSATGNLLSGVGMGGFGGAMSSGKTKLSNDGKVEAVRAEEPKTQTEIPNSMTPEEVTIVNGVAKRLEQPKAEDSIQSPIKPIEAKYEDNAPQSNMNLDAQMEYIRTHDRGGEAQAQAYKAQMEMWANGENLKRKEQGLDPITADDVAKQNFFKYENKSKPTDAELNTIFETATDANGEFKTLGDRNKSHNWQDETRQNIDGGNYTQRIAGERGLDSEVTTPISILKKLKEQGYDSLSANERAMVDRDIDTIRNHPNFKTLEQKDNSTHLNEHGELVDADGNYLFQSAYHGTPHTVDKFSTDKIGTGEGAQAYGHGLYFADSKEVAGFYKKNVSHNTLSEKIKDSYDEYDSPSEAHSALMENNNLSKKEKALIDALYEDDYLGFDYPHQAVKEVLKNPNNYDISIETKRAIEDFGNLYKVDLKPLEHEYLQWDKPLGEQSLHVREALNRIQESGESPKLSEYLTNGSDKMGGALYRIVGGGLLKGKESSRILHENGIKGIKYEDGNSRGRDTDKNHNYVIFNDKDVETIGANGKHYDPTIPDELFQSQQQGAKGSYKIDEKLITLFESHDVSTLNHELGHRFFHTLSKEEVGTVHEIFGVKDGEWKTEHHEAFADAYARYIAEGKTKHEGLRAVFEKFKEFSKNILLALKENNGGKLPPLSKEMKEFFAATLGDEKSRASLREKHKGKYAESSVGEGELFQTLKQSEHLKEVYKDSHPLTKNEDGTPKVFYHGTGADFSKFNAKAEKNFDGYSFGINFSDSPKTANDYAKNFKTQSSDGANVMPVYLDIKNPLVIESKDRYATSIIDEDRAHLIYEIVQSRRDGSPYDGVIATGKDGITNTVVFKDTQIKSIHNKPLSDGKSPDFTNPNILYQVPKNLLSPKQHSTIGDEVTRFKANMAKVKSVVSDVSKEISSYFRDLTPDYYKDIKEDRTIGIAKATDKAELIHQALIQLSDNTRKVLHNAIVGDIKTLPKGYEALEPIVKAIKTEVKSMSKKLVDLGMMSEKDAQIWGENYLKRSYEKHWNTKGDIQSSNNTGVKPIIARGKELESKDMEEIYDFADDALHVNGKKSLGTQMSIEDIKQHLEDNGMLGENIREGKVIWSEDANGKVTLRRDWTKSERENMGELEDAAVTVPNTLMSMGMMIENAKMMKELSNHAVHFADEADAKAQGYERVPMTKRYGAVAGLFVDKEIASRLKIAFEDRGLLRELYSQANTVFKVTHTAWNSASHINNFLGNMYTLFLMGRNTKEALQMLKGAFGAGQKYLSLTVREYEKLVASEFIGNLSSKQDARLTELKSSLKFYIEGKEAGLFGRGFITDVLRGYDAKTKTFDSKGLVSKAIDKVSDIYGKGDDIPRLSAYETLRKNGMSVKEAKEYVTALFPDYTKDLPTGIRWLRNSGIAPFISWSYYVLPNIAKLSKAHPMRATSALAVAYIGSALLSGINPFGDDLPDDAKGRRIPISKDGTTLKVDRMIPGFDFASLPIDVLAQIVSGVNRGDIGYGVNKAIQAGAKDTGNLAKSYLWGGLPAMAVDMLQNRDSYSGRSIGGESGDASKQAYNYAKYGASAFTPSIAQNIGTLLESKIMDKDTRKRHKEVEPRTTTQELLKLVGFNTMTYNTNEVQKKRDREYLKKMRE